MNIYTHSMGNGGASIYGRRASRVLRKRYRIEEIALAKNCEELLFEVSDFAFSQRTVKVYIDGKYYDFKTLERLKYKLPTKKKKLNFVQKVKQVLLNYDRIKANH